jgi:hypothetical protein
METSEKVLYLVHDLATSTWALAALNAALESGLLDPLTEPRSIAYLCEHTGMHEWLAEGILDVTVALGLVQRNGDVFSSRLNYVQHNSKVSTWSEMQHKAIWCLAGNTQIQNFCWRREG